MSRPETEHRPDRGRVRPSAIGLGGPGMYNDRSEVATTMEALRQRILAEGSNLGGGILKVDGFINHQVDPGLLRVSGQQLANSPSGDKHACLLSSGIPSIAPALTT